MEVEVRRMSTFWRRYGLRGFWGTCWVAASKALYPALGRVTMCAHMCLCWLSWTHKMGAFYWVQVICCCLIAKSCQTLCDPIGYSPPGSSLHGIHQARILEWVAIIPFSRGSSWLGSNLCLLCWADRFFTAEPLSTSKMLTKKENEIYLLLLFTHSIFRLPR